MSVFGRFPVVLLGAVEGVAAWRCAVRLTEAERRDGLDAPWFMVACALLCGTVLSAMPLQRYGVPWALAATSLFFALLHGLTDLMNGYIYDRVVIFSLAAALLIRAAGQGATGITCALMGAAAGWLPLAAIILVSRGGMGRGDARMMGGLGACLGWKLALVSLYLGLMIGGISASVLLAARRVGRRDRVPLAPFLATGVAAALLWGGALTRRFFGTELLECL